MPGPEKTMPPPLSPLATSPAITDMPVPPVADTRIASDRVRPPRLLPLHGEDGAGDSARLSAEPPTPTVPAPPTTTGAAISALAKELGMALLVGADRYARRGASALWRYRTSPWAWFGLLLVGVPAVALLFAVHASLVLEQHIAQAYDDEPSLMALQNWILRYHKEGTAIFVVRASALFNAPICIPQMRYSQSNDTSSKCTEHEMHGSYARIRISSIS